MKNLQKKLFLSCLKVTEILEKSKVVPLKLSEKIRLKIHLSMCKACRDYSNQSDSLDTMFKNLKRAVDDDEINSSKERLTKKLKESK